MIYRAIAAVKCFSRASRAVRDIPRPLQYGPEHGDFMRHILLIGMGGVGRHVAHALQNDVNRVRLSILVRRQYVTEVKARVAEIAPAVVQVVDQYDRLTDWPELAIECAGHGAVGEYGEACLTSGSDFLVTSVGALTDAHLLHRLERASRTHMG